ncbi:MAG: hypothetical protein K2P17_08000 [Helicobacteraceae bacterium]|nr:hypothetical protein [Helicobacteraceae bacterium]
MNIQNLENILELDSTIDTMYGSIFIFMSFYVDSIGLYKILSLAYSKSNLKVNLVRVII